MRRVAYWLLNSDYEAIVLDFCESEGLSAVNFSKQEDLPGNFVLFITDTKEVIEENSRILNTACCLISAEERRSQSYYVINEKLSVYSLRMLMDSIHHGGILWNSVSDIKYTGFTKECHINNNIPDIERVVNQLTWELMNFFTFSEIAKIRIGFSEMIINAIEHGNLCITNKEKYEYTETGRYYELLNERACNPELARRQVFIKLQLNTDFVMITICDEGDGFDTAGYPKTQEAEELFKLHGRGILITKAYFDSVTYNKKGNEVTLRKYFTR